jgi:hypothetical protein
MTCKKKRLKCDETKPGCEQCQRRGVPCEGYKKDYKWRSFEETTFTTKPAGRPKKLPGPPAPSINSGSRAIKGSISPNTSPPVLSAESSSQQELHSHDGSPVLHSSMAAIQGPVKNLYPGVSANGAMAAHPSPLPHLSPNPTFTNMFDTPSPSSLSVFLQNQFDAHSNDHNSSSQSIEDDGTFRGAISTFPSGSPSLRDLCLPGTDLGRPPDASEPRPPSSPVPYQPGSYDAQVDAEMDMIQDFDEEIVRQEMPGLGDMDSWSLRIPSPSPSDSSSSDGSSARLYAQPSIHPTSPEMLAVRFDRQTCGILSVKDGPSENPWRTYLWPLARNSPALYHALSSMTAFHASGESREMRVSGVSHMHKSIKQLSSELSKMDLDAALGTALALAFSESWDEHVSTGIQHLKGAKVLVNQAMVKHRNYTSMGQMNREGAQRMKFLCNTFVYMDVIARLTSLEEDNEFNFEEILETVNAPFGNLGQPFEVDPLLGCAASLFPLIGRVANLIQKVRKTEVNSIPIVSQAMELKQKIEQWQTPDRSLFNAPEDPSSDVDHCLQTAEAYRWAILLYLHQAVPEIPSTNSRLLSRQVLVHIACVPVSSRATVVQIFPLLAASCEVESAEERAWVLDRWFNMIHRLRIGNVDRCLEVVQEVWRRRDAFEAEKLDRIQRRQVNRTGPPPSMFLNSRNGKKARTADVLDVDDGTMFGADGEMRDHIAQARPSKKRFTEEAMNQLSTPSTSTGSNMSMTTPHPRRANSEVLPIPENMEVEYTVRGQLHWIGVMREWNWESKSIFTFTRSFSFCECGLLLVTGTLLTFSHFSHQFFLDDDLLLEEDLCFEDSAMLTSFGSVHRNSGDFSRLEYGRAR